MRSHPRTRLTFTNKFSPPLNKLNGRKKEGKGREDAGNVKLTKEGGRRGRAGEIIIFFTLIAVALRLHPSRRKTRASVFPFRSETKVGCRVESEK